MSGSLLNIIAYSTGGGSLPAPRRISRTLPASLCVMVDTARPLCWRSVNLPSTCQPSASTRKGEMPCSRTPSLNPPQQVPFFSTDLTQWFAPRALAPLRRVSHQLSQIPRVSKSGLDFGQEKSFCYVPQSETESVVWVGHCRTNRKPPVSKEMCHDDARTTQPVLQGRWYRAR